MANFNGSSRADRFVGRNSENNIYTFIPGNLSGTLDTIIGGSGTFTDTINFSASGVVRSEQFAGVTNVEALRLLVANIDVTISETLVASSQSNYFTIYGSTGADKVNARDDSSPDFITKPIYFVSNGGADSFRGGYGDDRVFFNGSTFTGVSVDGGGGFDTIRLLSNSQVDFNEFSEVLSFEQIEVRGGAGRVILSEKQFSQVYGPLGGDVTIQSFGSDVIDGSNLSELNNFYAVLGGGSDTVFGGAGRLTVQVSNGEIDATDRIVGGAGQFDSLLFTTGSTVTAASLAGVSGIETINIQTGNSSIALADNIFGRYGVTVSGANGRQNLDTTAITLTGQRVSFIPGAGSDTFIGGAESSVYAADTIYLNDGDTFRGGTGASDVLQIYGPADTVSTADLRNFTGIEQFEVSSSGSTLFLGDTQISTAEGYAFATSYAYNSTINAGSVTAGPVVFDARFGYNNTYIGGTGADIFFVWTADTAAIEGRRGLDLVQFGPAFGDSVAAFADRANGIEAIYITPETPAVLTINAADVRNLSNTNVLIIGQSPDDTATTQLVSNDSWTLVASGLSQSEAVTLTGQTDFWYLGNSFNQYTSGGRTLLVESGIDTSDAFGGSVIAPSAFSTDADALDRALATTPSLPLAPTASDVIPADLFSATGGQNIDLSAVFGADSAPVAPIYWADVQDFTTSHLV